MTGFASCCLLSYNRPQFVRDAILSCVGNAGHPLEMIVHDDGSGIETEMELRELRDAGLISLLMLNAPGHNEGQGIALNRMFNAAKGDPIIKLDHDLQFGQDWLKKAIEAIDWNERSSGAGKMRKIGALGLFKYHHEPVKYSEMLLAEDGPYVEVTDFVGSAMVIPREAWERFGPFEERSPAFAEDYTFKMAITKAPFWCCALTAEDLVYNVGFGPGPSTVVVKGPDGELTSREIKKGPKVLGA